MAICNSVLKAGQWDRAADLCVLQYDDRFVRRKKMTTVQNIEFLLDLPHTTSLQHGDAFLLTTGEVIEVVEAEEKLLEITAPNLVHLAWHIGNRHTPCQVEDTRLLIQPDHVIESLMLKLGATVRHVTEPFSPEGGAYGHGRTHGHDHSHSHGADHDH